MSTITTEIGSDIVLSHIQNRNVNTHTDIMNNNNNNNNMFSIRAATNHPQKGPTI